MKHFLLVALLVVFFPTSPGFAAVCRGAGFSDSVDVDGRTLVLNGLGLRLATLLKVKVYVAALYVAERSPDAARVLAAGAPQRLVLHFLRDVGADDLNAAWDEGFARNASAQLPALRGKIAQLKRWMTDMRAGQRLVFTHVAGGIAVDVADAPAGVIEGGDFAAALLSLWLGERPPNAELKAGLLGGACK